MPKGRVYRAVRDGNRHVDPQRCIDVECRGYREGWTTRIPTNSSDPAEHRRNQQRVAYIRFRSDRRYYEDHTDDAVIFRFPPGQRCFAEHRPPRLVVLQGGDVLRRHTRGIDFMEDLYEHEQRHL